MEVDGWKQVLAEQSTTGNPSTGVSVSVQICVGIWPTGGFCAISPRVDGSWGVKMITNQSEYTKCEDHPTLFVASAAYQATMKRYEKDCAGLCHPWTSKNRVFFSHGKDDLSGEARGAGGHEGTWGTDRLEKTWLVYIGLPTFTTDMGSATMWQGQKMGHSHFHRDSCAEQMVFLNWMTILHQWLFHFLNILFNGCFLWYCIRNKTFPLQIIDDYRWL